MAGPPGLYPDRRTCGASHASSKSTAECASVSPPFSVELGSCSQVDVGFGDAVTSGVVEAAFPKLHGFLAPRLRTYPRETVVAEKFEAMVRLGMSNTQHEGLP